MHKILCLLVGFFPFLLSAQELPPVINYSPNEYNAGNQNWMICQGENENFYFANGNGLLEYDGERWKIYPVPNNSIVRAVKSFKGLVYTGAYMEAGFWKRNEFGVLEYHSIIDKFPHGVQDGELFWDIQTLEGIVIFRSFSGIYFYDPVNFKVTEFKLPVDKPVSGLFKLNNNIYFQLVDGGLYSIKKGKSELVIPYEKLGDVTIKHLYGKENELRFITGHSGFFMWNGNSLQEFNKKLSQEIGYTNIFTAINLPNGDIVLGTVGKGILQVDYEGNIIYQYNQENILLNNTTLSLHVDDYGNIWAGLDYGICRINPTSPFLSFKDIKGKIGSVYASYLQDGNLYLGTNQGLYLKAKDTDDFNLIPGTNGQVWSLDEIDGQLFCGHDTGTFLIQGKKAIKICDRLGTWFVKKIKKDTYVQGHYYGFSFLKKIKGKFVASPLVKNFHHSSRNIEIESDSVLWVNNEHRGVFKVRYNVDLNEIEKLKNYRFSDSIWATSSMFEFADTLYYSTKRKIYQYDRKKDTFTEKNRLNEIFSKIHRISGKMVNNNNQKLWGFADNYIFYLKQSAISGDYEKRLFYLDQSYRNIAEGYENISLFKNDEYLLGVANGYLLLHDQLENEKQYKLRISDIQYSALEKNPERAILGQPGSFDFSHNNISFKYTVPVYNKYVKALYSYRLKGLSARWSNWTGNAETNFKNLGFGNYTFEVRAKVADEISPIARYSFEIQRPFYLSNLAIGVYLILFVLILTGVHLLYKRNHNKILEEKEKNLKMKNLEAEQKIIKLQNEHLERDVADKNRELAVSTMSLIKKNEFLTSIKDKLKESESAKVKAVIKTIDKDISEGGNWKFFKEAFNNADKDFFNKI